MYLVFLGPPACGKGTQAQYLVKKYSLHHLSTGDLLRSEVAAKTAVGVEIASKMSTGELISSAITDQLLKKDVEKYIQNGILFDGYPRLLDQAYFLDNLLGQYNKKVDKAICFDVPVEILVERIKGRCSCIGCGVVYNTLSKPPLVDGKCDLCKANLVCRVDDNSEVLAKRINDYNLQATPLKEYYQQKGLLQIIDASLSVDLVTKEIETIFN